MGMQMLKRTKRASSTETARTSGRSFLFRLIVPAWRVVGVHVEPTAASPSISRDEMEQLFSDVLQRKFAGLNLSPREKRLLAKETRLRFILKQ